MRDNLYYYDVYPRVIPAGKTSRITIRPLGRQSAFLPGTEVEVKPINDRNFDFDGREKVAKILSLFPDADGCLRLDFPFEMESEYFLSLGCGSLHGRGLRLGRAADQGGRGPERVRASLLD